MKALGTLLVALSPFAAGCGGDDAKKTPDKPAATQAPADTGGGDAPATVSASIKDFEFDPAEITVAAGGKVTWTNQDSANHTVTFKDEGGPKTIPNLRQDDKGTVTFADAGTFAYVCAYHPNMQGTVVVK